MTENDISYDIIVKAKEVSRLHHKSPGVYVLLDELGVPIYIGQSNSMKSRVRNHLTANSGLRRFAFSVKKVALIFEANDQRRRQIEEALIKHFCTPLNLTINQGVYCKGKKKDGTNCGAVSHTNGFCYLHGGNGMSRSENREDGTE